MNHETLQALYELDVQEVGEEEAAKRWETITVGPSWYQTDVTRRKPGIPWPKVMQQEQPRSPTYGQLVVRLDRANETVEHQRQELFKLRNRDPQPSIAWPADAPEWANYIATIYLEDSVDTGRISTISRIERPKPAKQKIDWAKLPLNVHRHMKQEVGEGEPLSGWIAWNCDEHTRGNPLPDGLLVEWYYNGFENGLLDNSTAPDWSTVTRFRIVGAQNGWK